VDPTRAIATNDETGLRSRLRACGKPALMCLRHTQTPFLHEVPTMLTVEHRPFEGSYESPRHPRLNRDWIVIDDSGSVVAKCFSEFEAKQFADENRTRWSTFGAVFDSFEKAEDFGLRQSSSGHVPSWEVTKHVGQSSEVVARYSCTDRIHEPCEHCSDGVRHDNGEICHDCGGSGRKGNS
jgi:hypothetical protein